MICRIQDTHQTYQIPPAPPAPKRYRGLGSVTCSFLTKAVQQLQLAVTGNEEGDIRCWAQSPHRHDEAGAQSVEIPVAQPTYVCCGSKLPWVCGLNKRVARIQDIHIDSRGFLNHPKLCKSG